MKTAKILVSIFHKDGKDNGNFEKLKTIFKCFDVYIPDVEFYGRKWLETKRYFLSNEYDSLFVICSDVSIICGDIIRKIEEYACDEKMGVYGFGTINNCTFDWLKYDNIQLIKSVPFIEGYCFGVNKKLFKLLELDGVYGYGIDVEMGYKANLHGLKCIVDSAVCIRHEYGKSYDNTEAKKEYHRSLIKNPDINNYLRRLNIFEPI
jgi:GT2 family glycosyltransferase